MEYDTERAGGFEPLRFVPKGKTVVLGLVTSKTGRLESKDEIKRRIDQAANFIAARSACLSPQCGFASTEEGNVLAEDEQWAKLRPIVEVAEEVWGGEFAFNTSLPGLTRQSMRRKADGPRVKPGGDDLRIRRTSMQRTKPPFRADHVGSLLRPAALKEARGASAPKARSRPTSSKRSRIARSRRHQEAGSGRACNRSPTASFAARGGISISCGDSMGSSGMSWTAASLLPR